MTGSTNTAATRPAPTACMLAKGCQRRVSAGMRARLASPDAAVLDGLAARDENVADDVRREQAVLDDARDRVEPRGQRRGVVEGPVEVGDHAAVGGGRRAGAN